MSLWIALSFDFTCIPIGREGTILATPSKLGTYAEGVAFWRDRIHERAVSIAPRVGGVHGSVPENPVYNCQRCCRRPGHIAPGCASDEVSRAVP